MTKKLILIMVCLALPMGLFAQQQTGDLIVKATDPTGAVVAGAKVTITGAAVIRPVEGQTDGVGIYRATGLPPGTYSVQVSQAGFATARRDNVNVTIGRVYSVDVPLTMGTTAETVEVVGAASDIVKSETAEVFRGEVLMDTPGGRDYTSFVNLVPSVNIETLSGNILFKGQAVQGISVDGSSGAENVFFVDGVDATNMYTGLNNQGLRPEVIQEFQLKTAGYEAEFGGAMGGVLSVVTRSGGNNFHGQVYYNYTGSTLTTQPRQRLRQNPSNLDAAEYVQDPEDSNNRNELGASLGGPILKEKLWFFVNVNPTWNNLGRDTELDDGIRSTFKRNELTRSGLARLDYQPLDMLRFNASYAQDTFRWKGQLPNYDGTDASDFQYAQAGFKFPSYTASLGMTATITPRFLVDSRFGYNAIDTIQFLGPTTPRWWHITNMTNIIPDTDPNWRAGNSFNISHANSLATNQDFQKKLTYNLTGAVNFNAGGQHNMKFGYQFNRLAQDVNDAYTYDYVRFNWERAWVDLNGVSRTSTCTGADGNPRTPCGYYEVRTPFGVVANIHTDRNAFFVQDAWTIAGRLTLNAGLRFEKEEIPSFSDLPEFAGAAFKWGFADKVAPRFGVAYDVFGKRKLKLFGSWGWFYDAMKLEMANGSFGGFKWLSHYYLMDNSTINWPAIGGLSGQGTYPGTFIETRNWRIPSFEDLDPNLMAMRMTEVTGGAEWDVGQGFIFSGRYTYKNVDRAIEDVGRQTPAGEAYYITNPGFGYSVSKFLEAGLPATPKAKRTYNAVEFRLAKSLSRGWSGDLSYVYSRLRGLYSGLGSSDENGRLSPNVDRDFDLWFLNYDSHGKLIDGPLNTDRPHQIKFHGTYNFPFNLTVGGFFRAQSGVPISRTVDYEHVDILVDNRMSDGRNPFFTQTDLYLKHAFKPFEDESKSIEVSANFINLFNQKTALTTFRQYTYGSSLGLWAPGDPTSVVLNGYNYQQDIIDQGVSLDPRFLKPDRFQERMSVRFGVRFIF